MKKAILKHNKEDLRIKMKSSSKLRDSERLKEKCENKEYARHAFKMNQYGKMNYMNETRYMKNLWQCDRCQAKIWMMTWTWLPIFMMSCL